MRKKSKGNRKKNGGERYCTSLRIRPTKRFYSKICGTDLNKMRSRAWDKEP